MPGVLYRVEMVEGNDCPPERITDQFKKKYGKIIALLLSTGKNIYSTEKVVILDSGFCVFRGIGKMRKNGLFTDVLMKKGTYWPKYIDSKSHLKMIRLCIFISFTSVLLL